MKYKSREEKAIIIYTIIPYRTGDLMVYNNTSIILSAILKRKKNDIRVEQNLTCR
jgi:S-adenosylmethionine:tRNA-ribosyltransferase-isomerase (queuine synthetase)